MTEDHKCPFYSASVMECSQKTIQYTVTSPHYEKKGFPTPSVWVRPKVGCLGDKLNCELNGCQMFDEARRSRGAPINNETMEN